MRTHGATRLLALILSLRYIAQIQTSSWIRATDRSDKILSQRQCCSNLSRRSVAAICCIVCLGLNNFSVSTTVYNNLPRHSKVKIHITGQHSKEKRDDVIGLWRIFFWGGGEQIGVHLCIHISWIFTHYRIRIAFHRTQLSYFTTMNNSKLFYDINQLYLSIY